MGKKSRNPKKQEKKAKPKLQALPDPVVVTRYLTPPSLEALKSLMGKPILDVGEEKMFSVAFQLTIGGKASRMLSFRTDIDLECSLYARSFFDLTLRTELLNTLFQKAKSKILPLRPNWSCMYCAGPFERLIAHQHDNVYKEGEPEFLATGFTCCKKDECELQLVAYLQSIYVRDAKKFLHLTCFCCGKAEHQKGLFQRCCNCKLAVYCSKECQLSHWDCHKEGCKKESDPGRRRNLKALRKLYFEEGGFQDVCVKSGFDMELERLAWM